MRNVPKEFVAYRIHEIEVAATRFVCHAASLSQDRSVGDRIDTPEKPKWFSLHIIRIRRAVGVLVIVTKCRPPGTAVIPNMPLSAAAGGAQR